MVNQTILDYNSIQAVTKDPSILVVLLIIWFLPILIYVIVASVTKARTSSGKVVGRMIFTKGSLIVMGIWFFFQAFLIFILLINPYWIKMLGGT